MKVILSVWVATIDLLCCLCSSCNILKCLKTIFFTGSFFYFKISGLNVKFLIFEIHSEHPHHKFIISWNHLSYFDDFTSAMWHIVHTLCICDDHLQSLWLTNNTVQMLPLVFFIKSEIKSVFVMLWWSFVLVHYVVKIVWKKGNILETVCNVHVQGVVKMSAYEQHLKILSSWWIPFRYSQFRTKLIWIYKAFYFANTADLTEFDNIFTGWYW